MESQSTDAPSSKLLANPQPLADGHDPLTQNPITQPPVNEATVNVAPRVNRDSATSNRIALCIVIHVAIDFFLFRNTLLLSDALNMALFAIPFSQVSLVGIWAANSRRPLTIRATISMIVTIVCWFLIVFNQGGSADQLAGFWSIAITLQLITVIALINIRQRFEARKRGEPSPFAFDVRSLMILTAFCAISFGIFQFACARWSWQFGLTNIELAIGLALVGVLGGVTAVASLWILSGDAFLGLAKRVLMGVIGLAAPIFSIAFFLIKSGDPNAYDLTWLVYDIAITQVTQLVFVVSTVLLVGMKRSWIA